MFKRKLSRAQVIRFLKIGFSVFLILFSIWVGYERYVSRDQKVSSNSFVEVDSKPKKVEEELREPEVREEIPEPEDVEDSKGNNADSWWEYPKEILPATRNGDDPLVLVNKKYQLPSSYSPKDLVNASSSGIRTKGNMLVRSLLIEDLKRLNNDAKADGIDLSVISAYRSYSTQVSTYQYWVNYNGGSTAAADKISARPGHSQHQLGTAVDFSSSEIGDRLGAEFNNTKAAKWLEQNGWKYGFVISYPAGHEATTGYSYESWHYRYIGVENAAEWKGSGEILEVWLRGKN